MIYEYKDMLDKLYEIHPEVEKHSLDVIIKRGLQGINRVMRSGNELLISNFKNNGKIEDWIKFFIYMTPEMQQKRSLNNFYKKKNKKENGKQTN